MTGLAAAKAHTRAAACVHAHAHLHLHTRVRTHTSTHAQAGYTAVLYYAMPLPASGRKTGACIAACMVLAEGGREQRRCQRWGIEQSLERRARVGRCSTALVGPCHMPSWHAGPVDMERGQSSEETGHHGVQRHSKRAAHLCYFIGSAQSWPSRANGKTGGGNSNRRAPLFELDLTVPWTEGQRECKK